MKSFQTFFILLVLAAGATLAELTWTITGTQNGEPLNPSDIKTERIEPSLYRLNTTARSVPPRGRNRRVKRTNTNYISSNWCGAIQHSPSTNPITEVHAYFQVPTLSARPGVSTFPQYVATWVGIDGATWSSSLLQTGVTSQISSTGVQTNWAWLEWIPDAAYNIASFPVATGDWIEVTVSASNATSGSIVINNLDQSATFTINLDGGTALGRVDADWIIEDPASSGGLVPLARFSETWFEDTVVTTANSTTKGINGATMYEITGGKCTSTQYDDGDFWATSS